MIPGDDGAVGDRTAERRVTALPGLLRVGIEHGVPVRIGDEQRRNVGDIAGDDELIVARAALV